MVSGDSTEKVPIHSHMLEYFGLRTPMLRLAVLITLVPMHGAVRLLLDTLRNLTDDVSQSLEISARLRYLMQSDSEIICSKTSRRIKKVQGFKTKSQ